MKIIFLSEDHDFTGDDIRSGALGGIPSGTIALSEAFVGLGHDVEVYNKTQSSTVCEGVVYKNLDNTKDISADLIISNNTAKPLFRVSRGRKVVWQRNKTSYSRAFKRGEWKQLLRSRPDIAVLSHDALANTPRYIPYNSRVIIPHSIENVFIRRQALLSAPSKPIAFFASRPSRNLSLVVEAWKKFIFPVLPNAELHVCFPPSSQVELDSSEFVKYNIMLRGALSKSDLAMLISNSRALLYPGHNSETGCQVALQSIGLGVPIVTMGIGCLKDQVNHGETGFIEKDLRDYARRAISCLNDDALWLNLHENTLKNSFWRKDAKARAEQWQDSFL